MSGTSSPGSALILAAVLRDTFQEARARWLFWGLFGLSTLLILLFLFALSIDIVQGAQTTVELGANTRQVYDINKFVNVTYSWISTALYYWGTLLALFASAGLVPVLLEPGRIALLLSKPVTRTTLLAGRFLGNVLIIAINNTYLVITVWLILGAKTHIWQQRFLLAIPASIFMFSVLLCLVMLVGVLVESAALSIMISVATMLISLLLAQRELAVQLLSSEWSRDLWNTLYWVVPKVWDIGTALKQVILYDRSVSWIAPVWTSALFGLIVLAAALFTFKKRDF